MSDYCDDCGCRVYNGACTNCDEVIYIAEQYNDLNMPLPGEDTEFRQELNGAERRQWLKKHSLTGSAGPSFSTEKEK